MPTGDAMPRSGLTAGFLTGVPNPKAIMFYMAFFVPFIEPSGPQLPQFLILAATSAVIIALVLGAHALVAAQVSMHLKSHRARGRMGYSSGFSC